MHLGQLQILILLIDFLLRLSLANGPVVEVSTAHAVALSEAGQETTVESTSGISAGHDSRFTTVKGGVGSPLNKLTMRSTLHHFVNIPWGVKMHVQFCPQKLYDIRFTPFFTRVPMLHKLPVSQRGRLPSRLYASSGRGTSLLRYRFLPAGALDLGVLLEFRRFLRVVGPLDAYRAQQLHLVRHLTGVKSDITHAFVCLLLFYRTRRRTHKPPFSLLALSCSDK